MTIDGAGDVGGLLTLAECDDLSFYFFLLLRLSALNVRSFVTYVLCSVGLSWCVRK